MGPTIIHRRRTVIVATILVTLLFLIVWYLKTTNDSWNRLYLMTLAKGSKLFFEPNQEEQRRKPERHKNPGLILDTPGCKISKLDPFDPSVVELYEPKDPYPCPGNPLFMYSQPDGSITLNETALETYYKLQPNQIRCAYQAIRRRYEKPGNVRENDYELTLHKLLQFGEPLNEDYVIVDCYLGGKNFTQYFPLARLKKEVEDKKASIPPPVPHLNVILAGVDSISKLNYLRHFKKTHAFIKEKNTFFEMKGYTKVGDNTFPNLAPLLTGRFPQDIWNDTVKDTMYFDDVDIIWKRYSAKGFRTFYAEDSPFFGTFNYGRRGFNETPTDYYIRPLYLALHNSELRQKDAWYCFNSALEPEIIYDYLRDFCRAMGPRPYFAFAMVSSLTHDYFNYAGHADYPTVQLLEDLWEIGANNNSMIVLFGDHGLRFGAIRDTYVGKFEERMPFMYVHFPPWFIEQYPHIAKNIRDNQERLVTLFDVHATMVHLLDPMKDITPEEKSQTPYGLSLMREISPYRTCDQAFIYPFWCTCQDFHDLPPDKPEVTKAADMLKDCINSELKPVGSSCPTLELEKVTKARLGQLNDMVLRFVKHENVVIDRNVVYGDRTVKYEDYEIIVVTKPGGREFEGTVRRDVEENTYCVVNVAELKYYERKDSCVDPQKLKRFSFCSG